MDADHARREVERLRAMMEAIAQAFDVLANQQLRAGRPQLSAWAREQAAEVRRRIYG
jgi:glutaredoxin-related protein